MLSLLSIHSFTDQKERERQWKKNVNAEMELNAREREGGKRGEREGYISDMVSTKFLKNFLWKSVGSWWQGRLSFFKKVTFNRMIAQWQNVDSASADGDYPITILIFWFWIVLLVQYFQNTFWKIYDSFVIMIPKIFRRNSYFVLEISPQRNYAITKNISSMWT
jgi:hypothetical protein